MPPLTPRSSEACRSLGVEPHELLKRAVSDFTNRWRGVPPEIVKRRQAIMEEERQSLLKKCRAKRDKLVSNEDPRKGLTTPTRGLGASIASDASASSKFASMMELVRKVHTAFA